MDLHSVSPSELQGVEGGYTWQEIGSVVGGVVGSLTPFPAGVPLGSVASSVIGALAGNAIGESLDAREAEPKEMRE
jgi:outer membrane lipoprotein SlyB